MTERKRVAFVVDTMPLQSDSVGFDCIKQYEILSASDHLNIEVRIFFLNTPKRVALGYKSCGISELAPWVEAEPGSTVIYHWRDGTPDFDAAFSRLKARKIVRWHNNTPPWFFARYSLATTAATLRGLTSIQELATHPDIEFWANSDYSAAQLCALGAANERVAVVHPMSAPLMAAPAAFSLPSATRETLHGRGQNGAIRVLFVGRFVPHKGHKHLVATAAHLHSLSGRRVELHLVGRADRRMQAYVDETRLLARQLGVTLLDHGEATDSVRNQLYNSADVFLSLSEHEGFGLPILEAMRFDLPVVGLNSTAPAEFLTGHPLSVDALDHKVFALRILATLDKPTRSAVQRWQRERVLPRYSGEALTQRFLSSFTRPADLNAPASDILPIEPDPQLAAMVASTLGALEARGPLDAEREALIRKIPTDTANRLVTPHDLEAFDTLVKAIGEFWNDDLYLSTWRQDFPKKRRLLSRLFRLIRRGILSLNVGLVRAMERVGQRQDIRLNRLSEEVDVLKRQNTLILEQLTTLSANTAALTMPAQGPLPNMPRSPAPLPRRQAITVLPAGGSHSSSSLSA